MSFSSEPHWCFRYITCRSSLHIIKGTKNGGAWKHIEEGITLPDTDSLPWSSQILYKRGRGYVARVTLTWSLRSLVSIVVLYYVFPPSYFLHPFLLPLCSSISPLFVMYVQLKWVKILILEIHSLHEQVTEEESEGNSSFDVSMLEHMNWQSSSSPSHPSHVIVFISLWINNIKLGRGQPWPLWRTLHLWILSHVSSLQPWTNFTILLP